MAQLPQTWFNPLWSYLQGDDGDTLRQIFLSLTQFFQNAPTFPSGVTIGNGTPPVYDAVTGTLVTPAPQTVVSSALAPIPGVPSATPGSSLNTVFVDVSWAAVADAVAYDVVTFEGATKIRTDRTSLTSFRIDNLLTNTAYTVEVASVNALGGVSAFSTAASFTTIAGVIESSNFVSGSTGWAIYTDGTGAGNAEFNGGTITGGTFRTAAAGKRFELSTSTYDQLVGYTGDAHEYAAGFVLVGTDVPNGTTATEGFLQIQSPEFFGGGTTHVWRSFVNLESGSNDGVVGPFVQLSASKGVNGSATLTLDNTGATPKITVNANVSQDTWHDVGNGTTGLGTTFANSWTNFGTPWQTARFMKDASGFVHIEGLIHGGTASTVVFTLPAGYRPGLAVGPLASSSNDAFASFEVDATGAVLVRTLAAVGAVFTLNCVFYAG